MSQETQQDQVHADKHEEAQRITDLLGGKVGIKYCPEAYEGDESFMSHRGPTQGHLYTLDFHPSTGLELEEQQWVDDRDADDLMDAVLSKLVDISDEFSTIWHDAERALRPENVNEHGLRIRTNRDVPADAGVPAAE